MLIVARVIQGSPADLPAVFSIVRDEFPRERVAGSIGLISAILGVGGGAGLVLGAVIVEDLSWHWLFWSPLVVTLLAALVHVALRARVADQVARPCELAGGGADEHEGPLPVIAIAQTTVWGWGGTKTIALLAAGAVVIAALLQVGRGPQPRAARRYVADADPRGVDDEPCGVPSRSGDVLVVHHLPAVRPAAEEHWVRVWRLGRGLDLFICCRQAIGMGVLGTVAGRVARRFGSKPALIVGTAITAVALGLERFNDAGLKLVDRKMGLHEQGY